MTAVCNFMDGPFEFRLVSLSPDVCHIELGEIFEEPALGEANVETKAVTSALQTAADAVIRACLQHRWVTRETEDLKKVAQQSIHVRVESRKER